MESNKELGDVRVLFVTENILALYDDPAHQGVSYTGQV